MKDFFDIFLHYMYLRMVSRIYLPKHVFKAVEKSAIFIALMVTLKSMMAYLEVHDGTP